MSATDTRVVSQLVNTARYPLSLPSSPAWKRVVSHIRHELETIGCSVLRNFIRPSQLTALRRESECLAPLAYYTLETVNAYNIALDANLPHDHPGKVLMERGNAFVARDRIPSDGLLHQAYTCALFQQFIADCFDLSQVYPLADPLAGLCLNVIPPGREHPWHFDTNEFTVSLLTQQQEAGGLFEFCPQIRTPLAENLEAVRAVLLGRDEGRIRRLELRPGDLQLFKGRYALHRVSPVAGATARHTAIFAYTAQPGIIGQAERTRQLFGRVLDCHLEANRAGSARADGLLD